MKLTIRLLMVFCFWLAVDSAFAAELQLDTSPTDGDIRAYIDKHLPRTHIDKSQVSFVVRGLLFEYGLTKLQCYELIKDKLEGSKGRNLVNSEQTFNSLYEVLQNEYFADAADDVRRRGR